MTSAHLAGDAGRLPLPLRLRAATETAHRRLEGELDLLRPPLAKARFTDLLVRFWGFHAVWEPAIAEHAALRELMAGRWRLDRLAADLAALGLSPGEIAASPRCHAAADLAGSEPLSLGSLYVLEGSTLGGRLIDRALRQAPWAPPMGLSYFSAHGPDTAAMWRVMQARLSDASSPAADPIIERGALQTFELLRVWLTQDGSSLD